VANWAGNIRFRAAELVRPRSVARVQRIVASNDRLRVLGSGHSFSPIADTRGVLVSLADLPAMVEVDAGRAQVRVAGGLRYRDVVVLLDEAGFALANLASLPHIGIAGAVATGTHGSGVDNPGLDAAVAAIELVTADGDLVEIRRGDPRFPGSVVSLGCLGVVVSLTLDLVPRFAMRQYVYERMPLAMVLANVDDVLGRAYSVSLFTTWRSDAVDQVWVKEMIGSDPTPASGDWLGARLADRKLHVIDGADPVSCTPQLGEPGPWYDRLPHFRLDGAPSFGDELQSEYLLPLERAAEALRAVATVADVVAAPLLVAEVRSVAADEQWLSPAHGRDTVALHFTWVSELGRVLPAVGALEAVLMPLGARPHWGKVFLAPPEVVATGYERLADFRAIAGELDPRGKFRNEFVDRYLFGA